VSADQPQIILENPAQNVVKWERRFTISRKMFMDEASKRLIPRLRIVDELPQWIIGSGLAAYQPWTRTIWIKRLSFGTMAWYLLHETIHHVIEVLGGQRQAQETYERIWYKCFGWKTR